MKRARLKRGSGSRKAQRMKHIKQDVTAKRIEGMLKENTGAHFLDSGGAYGRNWERNQGRSFEREPALEVVNDIGGDWHVEANVYHYLKSFLEVTPDSEAMNKRFKQFADSPENKDKGYPEIMETFARKEVGEKGDYQGTENTYNYDNTLSQVLQFTRFATANGKTYVILQVHGGADVRGGYTDPQVFELREDDDGDFNFAMNDFGAKVGDKWFSTDDGGYHWYDENSDDANDVVKTWRFNEKRKKVVDRKGNVVEFSSGRFS